MSQDILWIDHGWTFSTNFLQESYMAEGSLKAVHHYTSLSSVYFGDPADDYTHLGD